MADLSDTNSAQAVKVIGANSTGVEQTPVASTANGDLQSADLLLGPGLEAAITVGTSAVEVKVGGSALASRKLVTVHNNSNNTIYWGYTNSVTTASGTPIFKNQPAVWSLSESASVWLIAGSAGNDVRITESA